MNFFFRSDDEIIKAIKLSENFVFKWIYNKYYPMIRQFVILNSGTEEDAKDIFQTGVILLYEKIKSDAYNKQSSIKTFFYSICRNQWLKKLKQRKVLERITFNQPYSDTPETDDNYDDSLQLSDLQDVLLKQFVKLDENCQKILSLFYYDNLSMTTIAERIGYTSADNAKTQKYRCIQKLQGLMIPFFNSHKHS